MNQHRKATQNSEHPTPIVLAYPRVYQNQGNRIRK